MQADLSGETALVTGGAVGIGRAIALTLASSGADVVITGFRHDGSEVVDQMKSLGSKAAAFRLDAEDSQDVDRVVREAAELLGGLTILVNNAGGLVGRSSILEMSDDHWHQVINVNLSSAFYCTRAALPYLKDGGRVINISSVAAYNGGGEGAAAYATAKSGLLGLSRALAKELALRHITVNSLAPGFIDQTPFHATFTPPAAQEAMIDATPLKSAGTPEDVANGVLFFASPLGRFCTGTVLDINGGLHVR